MKTPLVSVLTITYNRADLIPRCIESIQRQTFRDYEHIIVDGNSTDNTAEVVLSYKDDHIKYIKLDKKGPAVQMEAAFNASVGDLVTFLDDDDEYLPEKLEKQVNFMKSKSSSVGLTYCWMSYFDAVNYTPPKNGLQTTGSQPIRMHKPTFEGNVSDIAISRPEICGTPTLMLRRSVIEQVGGVYKDDVGLVGSDWEFASRVCQVTQVACLPESLVNVYINHCHARLTTDLQERKMDREIVFHEYFLKIYEQKFKAKPQLAEYHLYNLCLAYIKKKKYKKGFRYYRQLFGSRPPLKHLLIPLLCVVMR